jgi:signal transduction histidine kinase
VPRPGEPGPAAARRGPDPAAARREQGGGPGRAGRRRWEASRRLAGGLGTGVPALLLLLAAGLVGLACLVGVGLLAVPPLLRAVRRLADRERTRLGLLPAGPLTDPRGRRPRDPLLRRELGWLATHGTAGVAVGAVGWLLPLYALRDGTFPLWWRLLPAGDATPQLGGWVVRDDRGALGVALLGVGWAVLAWLLLPLLARLQERPGRALLRPPPGVDLSLRVAELTASRAAALDAHAAELRRIERSLHDGAQNRLVAVTVLVGAARRAVQRGADPAELLDRAQEAAELALADLRAVVRSVLPPVLADRGLAGALADLAAASPVPCVVEVDVPGRCAASVEATAYFAVAEALTNAARHSGATAVTVTARRRGPALLVRVADDGRGGAVEAAGSGLAGLRGRVGAHDGTMTLTSPPGGPTTLDVELPCGS